MANDMTPEQLFTEAFFKFFSDRPVGEDQLRALYDIANLQGAVGLELLPDAHHLRDLPKARRRCFRRRCRNVDKIKSAPVTAIIGDMAFFENYPSCAAHGKSVEGSLAPEAAIEAALRNSSPRPAS